MHRSSTTNPAPAGKLPAHPSATHAATRRNGNGHVGGGAYNHASDREDAHARAHAGTGRIDDPQANNLLRRYLLRRFWLSGLGYWRGSGATEAWPLVIALFAIILLTIAIDYGINVWNRRFFDALEQRNGGAALTEALLFAPLAVASVLIGTTAVFVKMTLQRTWRAWLNDHVIAYWLAKGRYFQLNLVRGEHQNPEYRIADDLRQATESPVDFAAGLIGAMLSAALFMVVLWSVGGSLTVEIGGTGVTIPGFMVIGAILYALLGSTTMVLVGRRFVAIAERKNQAEAEYRYVLTRLRENGESIALLGGEKEERAGLDRSFSGVLRQWRDLTVQYMRTNVVSHSSGLLAWIVPTLLAAPKYLDGGMTLGQVMQAMSAFVIVQAAFGWLVDNYPYFANWTASARRVASLLVSLDALEQAEKSGAGYITQGSTDDAALRLHHLSITLDDGTAVVNGTEVTIASGERVLVVGDSGTGKSTLVRAIAGLWPWGAGEILLGRGTKLFLLPQRAYIPVGTLRRAACYPTPADEVDPAELKKVMRAVGLGYFIPRLDEEIAWDHTLSGGERQRLAFARLLIHRPDIVVLDEATSALDRSSQDDMMKLLLTWLPKTTVISVAHRPELEAFHKRKLVLESRPGGARLVRDVHLTQHRPRKHWALRLRKHVKSGTPKAA